MCPHDGGVAVCLCIMTHVSMHGKHTESSFHVKHKVISGKLLPHVDNVAVAHDKRCVAPGLCRLLH